MVMALRETGAARISLGFLRREEPSETTTAAATGVDAGKGGSKGGSGGVGADEGGKFKDMMLNVSKNATAMFDSLGAEDQAEMAKLFGMSTAQMKQMTKGR